MPNMKGVEMAETSVPTGGDDEDLRSRTTLRLDEETHFRLKWTSVVLRKSMQDCIKEALEEWLDKNRGAVQDVIQQSSHKIDRQHKAGEAKGGAGVNP
jgi:hypothetical protein